MRMLLHACCGPCSLEPSRILREEGHEITIFYANSNIAPDEEYTHRLETLRSWAEPAGFAVSEGVCDRDAWQRTAGRIGEAALEEARERVAGGCDRGRSSRPLSHPANRADSGGSASSRLTRRRLSRSTRRSGPRGAAPATVCVWRRPRNGPQKGGSKR